MKNSHLNLLAIAILLLTSCSEETSHSRTVFPDVHVNEFKFNNQNGYIFYPETVHGVRIDDFSEDDIYSHSDITFQGWADADQIKLSDNIIRNDIKDYLYDIYPDMIENTYAEFIKEELQSIKIYSNKEYNTIEAGQSLNKFFDVTTRLVVQSKNKYIVFDGDILNRDKLNDSFTPLGLNVRVKEMPSKTDKFEFFIDIKTDKGIYTTKIISVSLKGKS